MSRPHTLAFARDRAWLFNQRRLAEGVLLAAEEEIVLAKEQGFAYRWLAAST